MDSSYWASSWYQALTLSERIASLQTVQRQEVDREIESEDAIAYLQRWRSQSPFNTGSYFAQRLAMDGLSENEFLFLLGEPIEALQSRCLDPPGWLLCLSEAFKCLCCDLSAIFPFQAQPGQEILGFLDAIAPLISTGRDRLHEKVEALIQTQTDLPFDPQTVELILFANLPQQLLPLLTRTLVLEFHSYRQEILVGDTTQQLQSFLQRLRQRDTALALLQKYPVLTRQLILRIEQWVSFSLEFLHHLCRDWKDISAFSRKTDLGVLVALTCNLSERHCGGKTVLIAKFSSGLQVVYKPKPLVVEVHFQELLAWLSQRGADPSFRQLNILDRGSYGWVEFITASSCTCLAEIQRFYKRQGAYLALLYALRAIDVHDQNIIAAGEHPMLVDLEMLFQPDLGNYADGSPVNDHSVLQVGLLPSEDSDREDADLSGLGVSGQLVSRDIDTNRMYLQEQVVMSGANNRPTLNGENVNVDNYTEEIATGFKSMYQLLMQHRDELLASDGILARFATDPVRVVLRPSQLYQTLQNQSFHPDLLRNALERDRFFDRLWVAVPFYPPIAKVIASELFDLYQGDLPIFTTSPNERHLWNSKHQPSPDFLAASGMTLVQHRLGQLSNADLAKQLKLIQASLNTQANS